MQPRPDEDVGALIASWQAGDQAALPRLVTLVYQDLRRIARGRLRAEAPGHLLQTTALVHEVYLRLADLHRLSIRDRTHLLSLAARMMRQVLVDDARRRSARKRRGRALMVGISDLPAPLACGVDVLTVDDALRALAVVDARLSRMVELRFFAGFTIAEVAEALGVSAATVERDWVVARAWLYDRLSRS